MLALIAALVVVITASLEGAVWRYTFINITSGVSGTAAPSAPVVVATAAPSTAADAAVAPVTPGQAMDEAAMRAALTAGGWPVELHGAALAVAWCESGWRPDAVGDQGRARGLFQLWPLWWDYAGVDAGLWADPVANAKAAYAVYLYDIGRGYAPFTQWTCRRVLG